MGWQSRFYRLLVGTALISLSTLVSANVSHSIAENNTDDIEMPDGERWLEHLEEDLNPWWLTEEAMGNPVGNFPSFRCNDGELVDLSKICPAFQDLPEGSTWMALVLDKNFIVSKSRQVYTYGVAYHLTGDPKFLSLAKAGVDWIRQYGLDREHGGAFSYVEIADGKPDTSLETRTSQDLAYALQGMAFYYYLTLDQELLPDIIELKDFIFDNYYDPEENLMMWIPREYEDLVPSGEYFSQRRLLVSQLDQINAYLLLLASILPDPYQAEWQEDLVLISDILINQFYDPKYNVFWADIDSVENQQLLLGQADYGHSIKSLWMIYHIGQLVNDESLINFSKANADRLLAEAYHAEVGSWATSPYLDDDGNVTRDLDKKWWVYAELDQTAGALSLENPSYVDKYLKFTNNWWFDIMVDEIHHGVWNLLSWPELENILPKQYPWKNGFHTYEHALVGYITSEVNQTGKVKLYFARQQGKEREVVRPYYHTGEIDSLNVEPMPLVGDDDLQLVHDLNRVAVVFTQVK